MKKRIWIVAGMLTAFLALTACTRSDNQNTTANDTAGQSSQGSGLAQSAGNGTAAESAQGSQSGSSAAGTGSDEGSPVISVVGDDTQSTSPQNTSAGGDMASSSQDAGGEITVTAGDTGAEVTYDELNQSGPDAGSGETYDSIMQNGDTVVTVEWKGTYDRDDGEQLSINNQEKDSFFFRFEQCMIAGTARIDSDNAARAVYRGDDSNNIVFVINGGTIEVTVTNDEGDDTSEAVMTGIYEYSDDED